MLGDAQGTTPLMAAAMHGNQDLLKNLLARGVDAGLTDGRGCTALHYAVAAKKFGGHRSAAAYHAAP